MPYVKTVATSAGQESFEAIASVQSGPFPSDELGGSVAQRFTPSIPLKPSDQPWYEFEWIAPSGPITLITDPTKLAAAQAAVEAIEGGAPPTGPIEVVHTATGLSVFADTLAEALALSDPDDIWRIAPGTYTGGIVINVDGIIIEPKVGTARVRITPPDAATNGLQINATGIVLRGLEFDVPTAAHAVYVAGATATCALDECFFYGDSVGPSNGSAIRVELGRCDAGNCRYMGGVANAFIDAVGATAWLNAQGCAILTGGLQAGLRESGGAEVFAARFDTAAGPGAPSIVDGISLGAGSGRVVGSIVKGATNGLRLTADGGDWSIQNCTFVDCTLDGLVDPALTGVGTALALPYCEFSALKLSASPDWLINATYTASIIDRAPAEPALRQYGQELSVGAALNPVESAFGGGDSSAVGMLVFRNTNGTAGAWSDITADVREGLGPGARILSSTAAGAAVYFGSIAPHPGVKIGFLDVGGGSAGTALTFAGAGANAIVEVWDGAAWTEVEMMSSVSGPPYTSLGQTMAGQVGSEQVRYGVTPDLTQTTFDAGWKNQAQLSLNGSPSLYWSRVRLLAGITTSPESNAIKIHTSRTEINADGVIELFGDARRLYEPFAGWHRNLLDDEPGSPGNEVIPVSASITLTPTDNEFANGADDGVSGGFIWPDNADSSYPLRLQFFLFQSSAGAGDVHFRIAIARRRDGELFNGTAPELVRTFNAGDLGALPVPGVDQEKFSFEVDLPLNGAIGGLLPGDEVFIGVERPDSSDPDTFGGNVAYSNTRLLMAFYR